MGFEVISQKEDHAGLVWSGQVTPQYLAELQTGILPQLVHLVIFDTDNDNAVVHDEVRAYKAGATFGEEELAELNTVIADALEGLA